MKRNRGPGHHALPGGYGLERYQTDEHDMVTEMSTGRVDPEDGPGRVENSTNLFVVKRTITQQKYQC